MSVHSGIIPPWVAPVPAVPRASDVRPVNVSASPHVCLQTFSAASITLDPGLWAERSVVNRSASLIHAHAMFEAGGNLHNLRLAAGQVQGEYRPRLASDSDVYKWLEAVGYTLAQAPEATLEALAGEVIDLLLAAQAEDGYLMSYYQVLEPQRRWEDLTFGHELYCAGHLLQAAIAWDAGVGDRRLLQVAERLIDHIAGIFGPGRRAGTPGHPGIEMALIEFYRHTGRADCLALARFFLEQRGRVALPGVDPWVYQNHAPVTEQATLMGHAVRQMYLVSGATDLYLETGQAPLLAALRRQWQDMVAGKLYITGGLGQRHFREVFGDAYELPPDRCYCESCAAIGGIFWNWRLLLATGDARYADVLERTLYNGFLSACGLDGRHFFYVNPLMSRGRSAEDTEVGTPSWQRNPWYKTACCPPNIMRLIASLPHYFFTSDPHGLQIQQYAACSASVTTAATGAVRLAVATGYPWAGEVAITVEAAERADWCLSLRIPGWCETFGLAVNGRPADEACQAGYVHLRRAWQAGDRIDLHLEMPVLRMVADPRIDAVRGCVALQRGPVVYCIEQCDCPQGIDLDDLQLDAHVPIENTWQPELLGGVVRLAFDATTRDRAGWQQLYRPQGTVDASLRVTPATPHRMTAIPYFVWANRTPDKMRVWIPQAQRP